MNTSYLLGLDSRDRLQMGRGRSEWWKGDLEGALRFTDFAKTAFNPNSLRLAYWEDGGQQLVGGRLPEPWPMLLLSRYQAANPSGLLVVDVNDIWQGPDDHSPLALPGEDPSDFFYLPVIDFIETDPDHRLFLKYLPEFGDPRVVAEVIRDMRRAQEDGELSP
jgi:hypothetical protein